MPKVHLTVSKVKGIQLPKTGKEVYWCDELACFGVKATPTTLSYIVQTRAGKGGRSITHFIGRASELSLREARQKAMRALANIRSGVDLNLEMARKAKHQKVQAITLAQTYADFKKSRPLRPRTIQTYDENINRCLADWLNKPITSITKDMVEKRHRKLSNTYGPRGKGEASANQAMRLLRVLLNYAAVSYEDTEGRSVLPENPVKRLSQIRAWNKIQRRQDVIQANEMHKWYTAVMNLDNPVMRDYFLFCLFTGLRRTEAAQLEWQHIDTEAKIVTLSAEMTKTDNPHQLPLSDYLQEILSRRKQDMIVGNPFIFHAETGTSHIVEPKRSVAAVIKECKVKWSMHTLRRTFETTAEQLDISYYALKRLLNHRISADVTSGYIITSTERLRDPMQRITNYLLAQMKIKVDDAAVKALAEQDAVC